MKKDLKITQRRVFNQQRQINDLKAHHEDYDKKFQNTSRKLNAVLQELSRCKTELQYWRSKSPANSSCNCGKVTPVNDSLDFYDNSDNVKMEPDNALDEELKHAFSDEFKPIHSEEEFESKPSCSSAPHQPLPLVVPACHSKPAPVVSVDDANGAESSKVTSNKPFTRATKRMLSLI